MSITQGLALNWTGAGESLARVFNLTGDGAESRSVVVTDPAADLQVELEVDVSKIKLLYMVSSVDLQVDTNQVAPGVDQLNLLAGIPVLWYTGCGWDIANLFSADLTDLYLTASGSGEGLLEIRIIKDATP